MSGADRAETARFIRRMADLYEAGKLDTFEWTQRMERAYDPQPHDYETCYYADKDGKHRHHAEARTFTSYDMVNSRVNHPFTRAVQAVSYMVKSAHGEYHRSMNRREQEQRERTFMRDWYGTEEVPGALPDLFGAVERRRRMTKKAAARRYGHSYGKAKKDAEELMEAAPKEGPHRHRWLKERGL